MLIQGHAVHESYVQAGTVIEAPHLPAYRSSTNPPQSNTTSTLALARTTTPLLTGPRQPATDTSTDDSITVVMFSASFAGSWDEDDLVTDSVELASGVDVDKFVVDRLLATAQTVVDCGADVFACQKVNRRFVFFSFNACLIYVAVLFTCRKIDRFGHVGGKGDNYTKGRGKEFGRGVGRNRWCQIEYDKC